MQQPNVRWSSENPVEDGSEEPEGLGYKNMVDIINLLVLMGDRGDHGDFRDLV